MRWLRLRDTNLELIEDRVWESPAPFPEVLICRGIYFVRIGISENLALYHKTFPVGIEA